MLMDNGRYTEEDNAELEEQLAQHVKELRFRIECMWRQHGEYMSHPNGNKLAERLETDILICENHLQVLEANTPNVLS